MKSKSFSWNFKYPLNYPKNVMYLHRKSTEEGVKHLIEKKLPKVNENISYLHQKCDSYRQIAADLENESESTISFHRRWIINHEGKKHKEVGW